MTDLFIEIGCEELPSSSLERLSQQVHENFVQQLNTHRFEHQNVVRWYTPRRLILNVGSIATQQKDWSEERKGPALKACMDSEKQPTPAALGFAKSCGVEDWKELIDEQAGRLIHRQNIIGKTLAELLPEMIKFSLSHLPGINTMRWGNGEYAFCRPVHWLVVLLGGKVVECNVMGLTAGSVSRGHRFLCPDEFELKHGDWIKQYRDRSVLIDPKERESAIVNGIKQCLSSDQKWVEDPELLQEVTTLLEWVDVFVGTFDQQFLMLPDVLLVETIKQHQKCFAIRNESGALMPFFIGVSQINSTNKKQLICDNERVVHARLSDALFFFEEDQKKKLLSRLDEFDQVVYHRSLGSMSERIKRVSAIMQLIKPEEKMESGYDDTLYGLAKADLLTLSVYEFPELQHQVGYHLARSEGLPEWVATVILEHAYPSQSEGQMSSSRAAQWVGLAERIERMVGMYLVGEGPRSDRDPYAIRRAMIGLIRICIECEWNIAWNNLLPQVLDIFPVKKGQDEAMNAMMLALWERLKVYAQNKKMNGSICQAVLESGLDDVLKIWQRVEAIQQFMSQSPQASALLAAYKRAHQLLKKQSIQNSAVNEGILNEPAEKKLHDAIVTAKKHIAHCVELKKYTEALDFLSHLQPVIDDFFDQVMVMDQDQAKRDNRLSLMIRFCDLFNQIASFDCISMDVIKG